jgi:hypothetical protein
MRCFRQGSAALDFSPAAVRTCDVAGVFSSGKWYPQHRALQYFLIFKTKEMTDFRFDKDMSIEVTARLITRGSDRPLSGKQYTVRLFDKDFFDDDYLGTAHPDSDGRISIRFNPSRYDRHDPIREKSLDFYFLVYKGDREIFKSKVMEHVDIEAIEEFRMGKGEVIDLGSFLVDPH